MYIICDIDGTIADASHRIHLVQKKPKNWPEFFRLCVHDKPIWDIIKLLYHFERVNYKIVLVSGRSAVVEEATFNWIVDHDIPCTELFMRAEKDYRPDDIMKEELYLTKVKPKYGVPTFVLDDRDRVVAMWRKHGLRCLQVAPGAF